MMKQLHIVGGMICLALVAESCATFKKPAAINEAPVLEKATTKESGGIRASTAVVDDEQARQIFGIDLARKKIQAVWLKIENNTDRPFILLPTAIDPNYFTPQEVAFAYHTAFAAERNAALDEHLLRLQFPIRSPIGPGSHVSGYIFTNWSRGVKVIDVDLLGDNSSQNFTFFVLGPGAVQAQAISDRLETLYSPTTLRNVESEQGLRQALAQLPCCVSPTLAAAPAEPLNVVIIGALDDWTTAFMRRGYRYQELEPRYAFGRPQDFDAKKLSRGYSQAQEQTIRFWQTPIRYRGQPVWVAQTSTRLGCRFAPRAPAEKTLPLNPYVDDSRDDLTQDMAYSQALIKIGHVKGAGRPPANGEDLSSEGKHYATDGLRVVLLFGDRPASLATIGFFDWERLVDYR